MVTYFQVEIFYKGGKSEERTFTKFSDARSLFRECVNNAKQRKIFVVTLRCLQENEDCLIAYYA